MVLLIPLGNEVKRGIRDEKFSSRYAWYLRAVGIQIHPNSRTKQFGPEGREGRGVERTAIEKGKAYPSPL